MFAFVFLISSFYWSPGTRAQSDSISGSTPTHSDSCMRQSDFKCHDEAGFCISDDWVCDGIDDCPDASDENGETCGCEYVTGRVSGTRLDSQRRRDMNGCCQACVKVEDCVAWTFNIGEIDTIDYGECILRSAISNRQDTDGWVSGFSSTAETESLELDTDPSEPDTGSSRPDTGSSGPDTDPSEPDTHPSKPDIEIPETPVPCINFEGRLSGQTLLSIADGSTPNSQTCCEECARTDGCIGWTFFYSDSEYDECILRSTLTASISRPGWVSGLRIFPYGDLDNASCNTNDGKPHGELIKVIEVDDSTKCCDLCHGDDDCIAWTVDRRSDECSLLSSITGTSNEHSHEYGVKIEVKRRSDCDESCNSPHDCAGCLDAEKENCVCEKLGASLCCLDENSWTDLCSDLATHQDCLLEAELSFSFRAGLEDEGSYQLFKRKKNWNEARDECDGHGGILASIHSSEDNRYINEEILHESIWIGLNDQRIEGRFEWATGETLSTSDYSHWESGQPNNVAGYNEDCVVMYGDAVWDNVGCIVPTFYFVCSFPPGVSPITPEPCRRPSDFQCNDDTWLCISENWVCDGLVDCPDASDESSDLCDSFSAFLHPSTTSATSLSSDTNLCERIDGVRITGDRIKSKGRYTWEECCEWCIDEYGCIAWTFHESEAQDSGKGDCVLRSGDLDPRDSSGWVSGRAET